MREEVRKATLKLKEANSELKALDKAKSEFLSIASHQLRTPLTGVIGYASMLLEGDFGSMKDQEQTNTVKTIYDASQRLARVVNTFLNVSRIEAGRLVLNFERTNLVSLINETILSMKPSAKRKGIELLFDAESDEIYAMVDDKINEVFLNLVDNAIKYTSEGSVRVSLQSLNDEYVRYLVEDTGVGIAKDDVNNIFENLLGAPELAMSSQMVQA